MLRSTIDTAGFPSRPRQLARESVSPLTFDRVNGGDPITSHTPFFQLLPLELLPRLLTHLASADLAALAQVDRDCRQLARSKQFADVELRFESARSWELLEALESEVQAAPLQQRRWIGTCIRRLTLSFDLAPVPGFTTLLHALSNPRHPTRFLQRTAALLAPPPSSSSKSPPSPTSSPPSSPTSSETAPPRTSVGVAVLPHLYSFTIAAPSTCPYTWTPIPQDVLKTLRSARGVREVRLQLSGYYHQRSDHYFGPVWEHMNADSPSESNGTDNNSEWPLETCALMLECDPTGELPATAIHDILAPAAPTLRCLSLLGYGGQRHHARKPLPLEVHRMPRLEVLALQDLAFPLYADSPASISIPTPALGTRLVDLTLNLFFDAAASADVGECRALLRLPELQRLRWTGGDDPALLKFLGTHTHIQHLELPRLPGAFVEQLLGVLSAPDPLSADMARTTKPSSPPRTSWACWSPPPPPVPVSAFTLLTSLKLVWEPNVLPTSALATHLPALPALAHLWLSAGLQDGTHRNWLVDHTALYNALAPLATRGGGGRSIQRASLRTLVVTRDGYPPTQTHSLVDPRTTSYYTHRTLPAHISAELFLTEGERSVLSAPVYRDRPESESESESASSNIVNPSDTNLNLNFNPNITSTPNANNTPTTLGGPELGAAASKPESQQHLDFEAMRAKTRELGVVAWERWHAARMRGVAEWYFGMFRDMRAFYVGGILFERVVTVSDSQPESSRYCTVRMDGRRPLGHVSANRREAICEAPRDPEDAFVQVGVWDGITSGVV